MCGIAGILRIHAPRALVPPPEASIGEHDLDALDRAIAFRGPDDHGCFRDRSSRTDGRTVDAALVHRRLSVIDLDGGRQPMVFDRSGYRGRVAVVFNGCIYNHRALRSELAGAGHTFATDHSDTEVLLHGWREWGTDLFDRLDGMFAYAIWDGGAGSLTLARDRFGEKPLYWRCDDGELASFASVPHPLARIGGNAPLDPGALAEWLCRGYHPTRTPWVGVEQLEPGTWVTLGGASIESGAFAPFPWPSGPKMVLRKPDGKAFASMLESAVGERLEADVPASCLLSGGIDSSAVALAASRAGAPLTTLCVRMSDAKYDESEIAEQIAERIGSSHVTVDASGEPAHDLVHLIESMGLPFADSSLLPTSWAFRALSAGATVALTGDGGDELFMGYDRYRAAENLSLLLLFRTFGVTPPVGWLWRRDPKSFHSKLARYLIASTNRGYRDLLDIYPRPDRNRLLPSRKARRARRTAEMLGSAGAARRFDVEEHLPGDMLRKVDHASMSWQVESRAPLLARAIADDALSRPPQLAFKNSMRKAPLRAYLGTALPSELIDRPKMGFAIPLSDWFRSDFGGMRQLLHDHLRAGNPFPGLAEGGFEPDRKAIAAMLDEHDAAGRSPSVPWNGRDHAQRLYSLLVMSVWANWNARILG